MTLPELLKAAAEIKTAQLKSRPGRQEWEHSPDWIKYTAYHDAEVEAWRQASWALRLEACNKLKDAGNAVFPQDANAALRLYTRALSIFVWFDRGKDRASQDIPYINTLATAAAAAAAASGCTQQLEPEVVQANQTVATLFSNAANCLLKTQGSADSVVYACNKALEHDPYNVKALYRRALAQYSLGSSAGLEAAVADLSQALKLEPGLGPIRALLAQYQQELHEQNRKDARLFGGMFNKGGLYSESEVKHMREQAAAATRAEQALLGRGSPQPPAADCGYQEASDGSESEELGQGAVRPSEREVQRAVREMQQNMERARRQAQGSKTKVPSISPRQGLSVLPQLPWWGWTLILMHLTYRLFKIISSSIRVRDPDLVDINAQHEL